MDGQTDERTDICTSRVAFATEKYFLDQSFIEQLVIK